METHNVAERRRSQDWSCAKRFLVIAVRERSRWVALGVAVMLTGCTDQGLNPEATKAFTPPRDVLARVGTATLSLSEFDALLARRGRAVRPEAIVEEWVHFQATLAKARAAGYDRDPQVQAQWERLIAGQFQEREWERWSQTSPPVEEADVRAHYESHRPDYTVPPAVRVAVLQVQANSRMSPEKRQELIRQIEAWRELAVATNSAGFADLIRQRSEDQATRYRGGDVGWLTNGLIEAHWEAPVLAAAWQLQKPGEVSTVIETDRGFHLVRLEGRRPASVTPLAEARERIEQQLTQQRLRQQREKFTREMQSGLEIEINRNLLDSLSPVTNLSDQTVPALPGG